MARCGNRPDDGRADPENQHKNRCPHVWESDKQGSWASKKPTRNNPIFRSISTRPPKTAYFPALLHNFGKTEALTVIYSNAFVV